MSDFRDCFQRLGPDARILDVGCGVGHLTAEISRLAPEGFVLGVDNRLETIAQASVRFPPNRYPNLRFQVADARTLVIDQPAFDFVLSRYCLHSLDYPGQAFLSIAKKLRVGGSMFVRFAGNGHAERIDRTLRRVTVLPEWKEFFRGFRPPRAFLTPVSCRPWLSAARLKLASGVLIEEEAVFPSQGILLQWVRWVWSDYWDHIPDALHADLTEEFVRMYTPNQSNEYRVPLVWLSLEAVKF